MTKAKAQSLASFLIGLNYIPIVREENGEWTIAVQSSVGVTSTQLQTVESNQGVIASVKSVEFN